MVRLYLEYASDEDDQKAREHLGKITDEYKEHLQSLNGDNIFPPSNMIKQGIGGGGSAEDPE